MSDAIKVLWCSVTGGFHGELEGGSWRAEHGRAVGEIWWTAIVGV